MGPFIHNIDPVIGTVLGVHLWWYGLSYSLGFLNAHTFIGRRRNGLRLSTKQVYDLSLLIAFGVLAGGRIVEVVFYEWPFYSEHLYLVPAFWLGGMASHGLLLGGIAAVWLFCRLNNKPFLGMTDALAIPGALILGMGRIGNFIDGQILGSVTDVPWAVKFPDAEGFRHPVVLYDGLKNLMIIPVLYAAGQQKLTPGVITGVFVFLYSFLRIPVDVFREYPTSLLGLETGQLLNIAFSILGLALVFFSLKKRNSSGSEKIEHTVVSETEFHTARWKKLLFAAILLFSLTIPSDWTQNIPARYGKRHAGLSYSTIYPNIDSDPLGSVDAGD